MPQQQQAFMGSRLHLLYCTVTLLCFAFAKECFDENGNVITCDNGPTTPENTPKLRACIIGAGPAGLVSAKYVKEAGHEAVVFEQKDYVGGIWKYNKEKDAYSGMYEGYKTNTPKEIMMLRGFPFPSNIPSFMTTEPVLEYLQNYQRANGIQVHDRTKVMQVLRNENRWMMIVEDILKRRSAIDCDAVFVCNGHFFSPKRMTDHSKFEGTAVHSQDYREASAYAGRRVAVIGAGPSGLDIAQLVAEEAQIVYLIGSNANYKGIRWNVKQVKARVNEIGSNWIKTSDNNVLPDIDDLIFCTGFDLKFPFLSSDIIQVRGDRVTPLYEHVLHREYPDSLFFIGVNSGVSHFVLNEQQARYAVAIMSKQAPLPSAEELGNWEPARTTYCEGGSGFHDLTNIQFQYMERLAKLGNFEYWENYKLMEKMFHYTLWIRGNRLGDYKDIEFKANWPHNFTAILPATKKRLRIAVIGAGPAGLVTARHALDDGHEVVVFEQRATSGGAWHEANDNSLFPSMYEGMITNSPKELMLFQKYQFAQKLPSFMPARPVLKYLQNFARDIPINFDTTVESVDRTNGFWQIVALKRGKRSIDYFDAVFVCNGHFNAPRETVDTSKFKGTVIHSRDYRNPAPCEKKKVVIIGAGPSGVDIAMLIADHAEQVYLVGSNAAYKGIPTNVKQIASHVKEVGENSVIFDDGKGVIKNVDVIILCTGFKFEFPFLSNDIVQVSPNGQRVSPLYEHILHRDYPDSLFFIGLNSLVSHFPLNEQQARFALAIATKKVPLPSGEELAGWEQKRLREVKNESQFHILAGDQWPYMEKLAQMGKFDHWPYYYTMEKMFKFTNEMREQQLRDYKKMNFTLVDNEKGFVAELPDFFLDDQANIVY